jgi:hypothetical protein
MTFLTIAIITIYSIACDYIFVYLVNLSCPGQDLIRYLHFPRKRLQLVTDTIKSFALLPKQVPYLLVLFFNWLKYGEPRDDLIEFTLDTEFKIHLLQLRIWFVARILLEFDRVILGAGALPLPLRWPAQLRVLGRRIALSLAERLRPLQGLLH